jgi:hypothetical protein
MQIGDPNMILNTLKAGVVALALAGTALAAVPVQAAPFGFHLNLGGGGGGNGGIFLHFGDDDYFDFCWTDKQVAKALANKGYSKLQLVKKSNSTNKVWFVGRRNGDWWLLRVDVCTGKVDVKEIHPINEDDDDIHFNLTFTF